MKTINQLKQEIDKSLEFHGVSGVVRGIIRQLIENGFEKELRMEYVGINDDTDKFIKRILGDDKK